MNSNLISTKYNNNKNYIFIILKYYLNKLYYI